MAVAIAVRVILVHGSVTKKNCQHLHLDWHRPNTTHLSATVPGTFAVFYGRWQPSSNPPHKRHPILYAAAVGPRSQHRTFPPPPPLTTRLHPTAFGFCLAWLMPTPSLPSPLLALVRQSGSPPPLPPHHLLRALLGRADPAPPQHPGVAFARRNLGDTFRMLRRQHRRNLRLTSVLLFLRFFAGLRSMRKKGHPDFSNYARYAKSKRPHTSK